MAPAAADTIAAFLRDTGTTPGDYDLIITGDLGYVGSELLLALLDKEGIDARRVHDDCGKRIFDRQRQDVHSGGSGCGCSASVLCACILPKIEKWELKRVLFCATGALMSPELSKQGESIPGISHAVSIERA
jgi:stage V sporulation protein AD